MRTERLPIWLALAAMAGGAAAAAATPAKVRRIGDAELVRFAASKFNKAEMMSKRQVVGLHRGTLVVADYPCGDVCPTYTRRIVHYDVPVGDCARVRGAVAWETVPRGPAATRQAFCEPAILIRGRV